MRKKRGESSVKMQSKYTSGFTLIELIVVIVILGIMAAIAGPKFVDLQTEARTSVINGVEGAVRSTATLVYSKSLIESEESIDEGGGTPPSVQVAGGTVTTRFGYPNAENTGLLAGMDLQGDVTASTDDDTVTFTYTGRTNCQVTYQEAQSDGDAPNIVSVVTGC